MIQETQQKSLTKLLAIGTFLISVAVTTSGLTDPVNVPKFLILGMLAFASAGIMIQPKTIRGFNKSVSVLATLIIFVTFSLIAALRSASPLAQNIYGSYGRNNGFLTYLFLSIILLTATQIQNRKNHLILFKSLMYVGYVNLIYCLWVILFGDFIPWNNPYGNILGTFGNPNFIGAFFGMFFGVIVAFGFGSDASKRFKLSLLGLLPLTLFEIVDSNAIQGRVLAVLSLGIVGFFFLRFKIAPILLNIYTFFCLSVGGLALAGAFQKGPLTEIIYKTSVSLRGQYWLAAWNTGQANPISGVGMDGFGDWYRRARDIRAIELPGVNTVVNTAHNVPLDMFAFGGWPLFISYLLLMGLALKSLFAIALKMKKYDAVGVGLITAWTCYQVQSIISINQIGLAVWGWLLSGLLIGYEKYLAQLENKLNSEKSEIKVKKNLQSDMSPSSVIAMSGLGLVGLIIALPPLSADVQFRAAQVSRDVSKLEATMKSSYFNPQNSQKYSQNIQAFESNGLFDLSHKYALEAVKWDPESFEFWRILFLIKNSTSEEKALAVERMKNLDPLNPDVTAVQ